MSQVYNPIIPYNGPIPGGVYPGRMIRINGNIPITADKFAVNLVCGSTGDIALHVSPHLTSHHVVRNSVQHMKWGHEEKNGGVPVQRGQNFDLIILCEPNFYKIAFNGVHFTEFNHRIPPNFITNIAIDGSVIVRTISFEGSAGGVNVGGFAPVPHAPHVPHPPHHHAPHVPHIPHAPHGQHPPAAPYPHAPSYPPAPGHYPHGAPAYPTQPGLYPHGAPGYPGQPNLAGLSPHAQTAYPHSPTSHKKTSLLDKAGMAVAGALGASSLMGGHKYNKLGAVGGGGLGTVLAGAAMTGHLNPKKAMKKHAKAQKKALKYGLPIAGVGLGAYAMHKGMHKIGHHRRSSSSSSSSSD